MTYSELLRAATKLAQANEKEDTAVKILLLYASKKESSDLLMALEENVPTDIEKRFNQLVKHYIFDNIPVQHLTNSEWFYGYTFFVDENVLIPRRETEELVSKILLTYDEVFSGDVNVVDIGTGSGAIAITLDLEEPHMHVSASDISEEAIAVAEKNNKTLEAKVNFKCGDMLQPFYGEKFDILVSNPPYIPAHEYVEALVLDNEPHVALFGGDDGLKFYRVILENAHKILNDKSVLAFEHAYDKKEEMYNLVLQYFPNADIRQFKDMQGKDRMTVVVNK